MPSALEAARGPVSTPPAPRWPAALCWALAWGLMLLLDGWLERAQLALLLVLAAAVAALWLPAWASLGGCALAVLAFNWQFVPPRGTLRVDFQHDALLLLTLLTVGGVVAVLLARQRHLAAAAQELARRSEQLRLLGQALRDADTPDEGAALLLTALQALAGPVSLRLLPPPTQDHTQPQPLCLGEPVSVDEAAGLTHCQHDSQALGPGTGRHEEQAGWYVPLRGRHTSLGAALLRLRPGTAADEATRLHAQALCDQMGLALERAHTLHSAARAREEAATQGLRNTLLAAIAHDQRTPLATMLGAATALRDQADRLSPAQREQLLATLIDEARQLARLTDNTLQLARLESALALRTDWESVEELAGTVLRHARQRHPMAQVQAQLDTQLPLLRCDAVLLVQLLDNLVDNALRHGAGPVRLCAQQRGQRLWLAVQDHGPGLPADKLPSASTHPAPRRGVGMGLALCQAIARVHGGQLSAQRAPEGGASVECLLPLDPPPLPPQEIDHDHGAVGGR